MILLAAAALAAPLQGWGVGPRIASGITPGGYPVSWPKEVDSQPFGRVGADLDLGVETQVRLLPHHQVGGMVNVSTTFSKAYWGIEGIATWDYVEPLGPSMDLLGGAGLGVSYERFQGVDGETLQVESVPLRGSVGILGKLRTTAIETSFFTQWNMPTGSRYQLSNGDLAPSGWGWFVQLGVEVSVLFGDFTPQRPHPMYRRAPKDRTKPAPAGSDEARRPEPLAHLSPSR